ncbi:MAG: FKBP-type peptidyl-prolyl cis-trans isomerase [Gemmatimonadales bacterium]
MKATLTPPAIPPDTVPEMVDYDADLGVNVDAMKKLPAGVLYEDVTVGAGDEAAPGDEVDLRLVGWLPDGTRIDSLGITVRLGAGDLLQGLEAGIPGMRTGGRRKLVIPPGLAYGGEGRDGVPAQAVVVYDVELFAVRR